MKGFTYRRKRFENSVWPRYSVNKRLAKSWSSVKSTQKNGILIKIGDFTELPRKIGTYTRWRVL